MAVEAPLTMEYHRTVSRYLTPQMSEWGCIRGLVMKHRRKHNIASIVDATSGVTPPRGGQELNPPHKGIARSAACCALISSFLFGYSLCVLDTCLGLLPVVFEWCNSDWQSDCLASRVCQGLVNASVYLGAALGAILSGRPYFIAAGSRWQIIFSDVLFIAGALLCTSAQGVGSLLLGRLTSGVGLGLSAIAAPVYIAEVSPRERRGSRGALHGLLIALGIWFSITVGLPQSPPPSDPGAGGGEAFHGERMPDLNYWYWRLMLGFAAVPALVQLVLFKWVLPVDPPSFLVQKKQIKEARSLLYRTYGLEPPEHNSPTELGNPAAAKVELMLSEMVDQSVQAAAIPQLYIYQAVCDPFLRCALFLGLALAALQQLSGINALMSYSNVLFSQAGIPSTQLTLASTLMATCNACASLCSTKVVDHWGRRKLLLMGSFLQTVAMFTIHLCSGSLSPEFVGPVVLACFSLFTMAFSAGLGAVTWLYLSEIYPMEIRGSALSACGVINWLSCFIVVFGTPFLSIYGACRLFGVICFFGCIGVYLWVVETKGCSMEDSPLTPRSLRSTSSLLGASPQEDPGSAGCEVKMSVEHH